MEDDDEFIIPQFTQVLGVTYKCSRCGKIVFEKKMGKNEVCEECHLKDSGMYA